VTSRPADAYRGVAERAWRWVLDQVRHDANGPWIPWSMTDEPADEPAWDRDGMHSGIGGLAHVLAEIRETRPWTDEEAELSEAIAARLRGVIPTQTDAMFFDGIVSAIGALTALAAPGVDDAVGRLAELGRSDGWPQTTVGPPRYVKGARVNDLTLGTAGVLLGLVWAHRHAAAGSELLANRAADILLAEAEDLPSGINWPHVSVRFVAEPPVVQMPNLSHGLAGIAAAIALAGVELGRPELVEAARSGADHLVTLADTSAHGFVVPRTIPPQPDQDEVTYSWCHGPTGTSLLFRALRYAGVADVAGHDPDAWHRRCLLSVRSSGLPDRLWPGFWDNDGRCCGTAGVGDVLLDSWHMSGSDDDLRFALSLADTLVERAIIDGPHAYWRFIEHRDREPLLPPGVGWMQGAAGIAAYLFHAARVAVDPDSARAVPRIDNWWAVPAGDR
jgi:hypothetical protein